MIKQTQARAFPILILMGSLLALVPHVVPQYILTLLISILILSIYAGGVNLLYGYNGRISIGHATFWGAGAYSVAILTTRGLMQNFYLVMLISLIIVTAISMIIGFLVNRVRGVYFMILTFTFGHIFYCLAAYILTPLTGGEDGVKGIVRPDVGLPWNLSDDRSFYYLVLSFFLISFTLLYRMVRSPFGHALVGIRDNEGRMETLGYNTHLYNYVCYILSALFAGLAGSLFAYSELFVSTSELYWFWSGEVLLMVLIGGIGTLWGPVMGAAFYTLLRYYVSRFTDHWLLVLGMALIFIVLFLPKGMMGFLTHISPEVKRGNTAA